METTVSPRMLLVEDDKKLRMLVTCMFETSGYCVTPAPTGEIACRLLEHTAFDVVLTDIHLGPIDGMAVLRAAHAHESCPALVAMTGSNTPEVVIAAFRAGANDCLLKPCSATEMAERVQAALNQRALRLHYLEAVRTICQLTTQVHNYALWNDHCNFPCQSG